MELHPLTTRRRKSFYISLTHEIRKKKKKKKEGLSVWFFVLLLLFLNFFPYARTERERERERLCGLGSFPPWIFNLVFLGF
jgi:hypothetical protein